jgi:hypothetical protein
MEAEILEEGSPCDYCGKPIEFFDDDFALIAATSFTIWTTLESFLATEQTASQFS